MAVNEKELLNKIEEIREEMIISARKYGLLDGQTIKLSEELDVLLVMYQRLSLIKVKAR